MSNYKEWYNQGKTYEKIKEYDKAIECYKKVIEIDPKENMGSLYRQLKQHEKAIEYKW